MTDATTFAEARDAIQSRFKAQFDADVLAIVGGSDKPLVVWDNVALTGEPPKDKAWFRVNVKHSDGDQVSLGEAGTRKFSRDGIVTVQIFIPAGARGLALADRLGKMTVDAFEGKAAAGVWFRRVKLVEVGPDGPWFQYNVTAAFTYELTK